MQDLIKIEDKIIGEEFIKTVNARDLYNFLEVRKDFSNWIKQQIERADLKENEDYIKSHLEGELINQQLTNVGNKIEYYLTLDSGKNIGMMSNCQRGKDVRKYFIECEKELRENHPRTYLEAIEALVVKEKERLALEKKINNSTLFPDKEYSDGEKAYKKDIKLMYPFLGDGKINNILEFYTTKKYKDSVYYIKDEVVECMKMFFKDCKYRISDSRISVIANHKCLLNSKCVISKEYAIEYLNFLEEEFDL